MAENENKKTIYQNLNKMLNLDGTGFKDEIDAGKEKKIIIKGASPQDVQRKTLELQQAEVLRKKFNTATDHGFQKAMQYEAARLPAYLDYEGMEYYPLIASALDLIMEEATTIGEDGHMLKIYSDKERIANHLNELFFQTANVNVMLPAWGRNMAKYGDNFVYLLGEKKRGITAVKQLVNYEMERIERIHNGKATTKFKQRETNDEFNIFEIAHFRLLGDDKYLPYGSSILNKIRRVFRQLIMAEDAMLTYRIIRAGEKRVFKVDVGNIDEDDIESYIHKIATRFKKQQQIYPDSGQIDYRFNILGNDEDIFLPVRNQNVQTGIETLPGAQNLDQIHDIEYLRDNLFTGLGIPKPFLGFQEASGDGKNMAQMDIRFSKKINRIQQALIQELNKMAMIHLYLLGFRGDEVTNFTLSLTNPSTQQELLKTELLQQKAQVYTELTRNEGGIAAMSHTNAKRLLFSYSDKDIIDDFKKQRMERAVAQELQDSPLIIRQTGIFKDIDAKYGTGELPPQGGEEGLGDEEGGFGGLEAGEGQAEPNLPPVGGGGAPQSPNDLPPVIGQGQGFKDNKNVLAEKSDGTLYVKRPKMTDEAYNNTLDNLVLGEKKVKNKSEESKALIKETGDKNVNLNTNANHMVENIDKLIGKSKEFNTNKDLEPKNFTRIDEDLISDIEIDESDLNEEEKK